MRRYTIVTVLTMLSIIFLACEKSVYREVQQYSIEQFLNNESIRGSSFSPEEDKILFSSNRTGIYNAYTISIDGGQPTQLTESKDNSIFTISYLPNDHRILFRSDDAGNEIWHIFLREEDGSIRDLTPYEGARAIFSGWSHDEKSFFFASNKRDRRFNDLYEMDIQTFSPTLIFQNDEGYSLGDISNNKRYLAFTKIITEHNTDIYFYDFNTKTIEHLTPHEGDIVNEPQTFAPDSRSLYYLTNEECEFSYLKRYDIETGNTEIVQEEDWDIWYSYFSHLGMYRIAGINEDARTKIRIFDNTIGKEIDLPVLPAGDITSVNISKSERFMTFYHNGSTSPSNLYVYSFESNTYRKLTDTMNPEINQNDLVEAQIVRYKSFDDLEIPAVYYRPYHIKRGEKAPALIWVHGGPGGQSRIGYRGLIQYLVNHGYVVLAVNNRGSTGYGKTFYKLDDLKHGEDDLDDCVEAKKFLASTGYVDENKIGIIGGSYGGYMVLAALTFRPDEFATGVDIFGISNWVRTLKSIPPWWEAFKEALYKELGNPETDEEYLRGISPLFHAENIVKPLMVLQGANDPRVLKVESDEIVEAVRKNNVPVEYLVFEDEGHGLVKKENQIKGYQAILSFLDRHLKGKS